ncbi:MAG: CBS domain-containing protein [Rhodospirillaceae bacterium]|nr:CBS domain-containing protein [Rhodospirillales bacterium]
MATRVIREVIKHRAVVTMPPKASVREAAKEMSKLRIGAVVVVENGRLAGIFTERDGLFRVLADGLDPDTTLLEQVMTTDVTTISADKPLLHALHLMQENSFRHLPVVDGDVPKGMLSIRDALDYELVHFLRDMEKKEALTEII